MSKTMNEERDDESLPRDLRDEIAVHLRPRQPPPERAAALRASVLSAVIASRQGDGELAQAGAALRALTRRADQPWEERWPGIEICTLRETDSVRTYLMRMRPGAVLPAHAHSREEVSLIVEGDAEVAGIQLQPGDFQVMPAGEDHAAIRSVNGCIAFVHGEHGFRPRLTAALVAGLVQVAIQRFTR